MGKFLLAFAIVAVIVYSMVDVARARSDQVRLMPRWLWGLGILLVPPFGSLFWFLLGRPRADYPPSGGGGGLGGGMRPQGPGPAPDDDPEFLKRLDEQSWAARMERLRRERESGGADRDGTEEGQGAGPSGGGPADRS